MSKIKSVDHLSNEFDSVREMCAFHGVSLDRYYARKKSGMSLDLCLSKEVLYSERVKKRKVKVKDFKGNEFLSIREMCEFHGVTYTVYRARIYHGWTQEEALTKKHLGDVIVDHLGNEFDSVRAMCEYHNVSVTTFNKRNKNGMSLCDCLKNNRDKRKENATDHLGQEFKTVTDMCNFWKISRTTYQMRIRLGYSKEDALTKPVSNTAKSNAVSLEYKGIIYNTIAEFCIAYGLKYEKFYRLYFVEKLHINVAVNLSKIPNKYILYTA